jgi:hypothetical protein
VPALLLCVCAGSTASTGSLSTCSWPLTGPCWEDNSLKVGRTSSAAVDWRHIHQHAGCSNVTPPLCVQQTLWAPHELLARWVVLSWDAITTICTTPYCRTVPYRTEKDAHTDCQPKGVPAAMSVGGQCLVHTLPFSWRLAAGVYPASINIKIKPFPWPARQEDLGAASAAAFFNLLLVYAFMAPTRVSRGGGSCQGRIWLAWVRFEALLYSTCVCVCAARWLAHVNAPSNLD